jgi:methylenetetrahydrofolate--tRNA-(uracil-5-)-methyltransferase
MYNMVGFQTKLTYTVQNRVFRMFLPCKMQYFSDMGDNTYTILIRLSSLIVPLASKGLDERHILVAGQITGVVGYVESVAMGLIAGISATVSSMNQIFLPPPGDTCVGALLNL